MADALTGVALVTGSSSGIGAAIARALAGAGMTVVLNSRSSSAQAGEALAAELAGASYLSADIADEGQAVGLVAAAVERHGRLDLLVNNAGTTVQIPHGDLDAVTTQVWRDILDTNVLGTWHVTKAAVPHLRASGAGHVVNITSMAGVRAGGSSVPYAVSKAAENHLTRLLAAALGPAVRVNAVAPGLIATPWTSGESWQAAHGAVGQLAPLRRVGTPEDIADAVLGLARSAYVTGEVLVVDGGLQLRM